MKIPTFEEELHELCCSADMKNEQEATELVRELAINLLRYHHIAMSHEDKLMEVMSAKDYAAYSHKISRELFEIDVNAIPDGSPFKDFILENFNEITGGEDSLDDPEDAPEALIDTSQEDDEQWYIFTFGAGQQHEGHYVRIQGTYESAREEMFRRYGSEWAFQYSQEAWNDWLQRKPAYIPAETELIDEEKDT